MKKSSLQYNLFNYGLVGNVITTEDLFRHLSTLLQTSEMLLSNAIFDIFIVLKPIRSLKIEYVRELPENLKFFLQILDKRDILSCRNKPQTVGYGNMKEKGLKQLGVESLAT